jgi:hypothetical protein
MKKFAIGQKVKLAFIQDLVFEVIQVNYDESYEIQAYLTDQDVLHYGNVSAEMLTLADVQTCSSLS